MPVCPNGCADDLDQPIELESGFDQNHRAACMCECCGYLDLRIDLHAA